MLRNSIVLYSFIMSSDNGEWTKVGAGGKTVRIDEFLFAQRCTERPPRRLGKVVGFGLRRRRSNTTEAESAMGMSSLQSP